MENDEPYMRSDNMQMLYPAWRTPSSPDLSAGGGRVASKMTWLCADGCGCSERPAREQVFLMVAGWACRLYSGGVADAGFE
jgi:hypothetical protein